MLGLTEKVDDLQRLFTTAQLSRILGIPVPHIRSWMRRKLIRPAKVARRLAWFDFREVAMARALHTLTSAGVSTARIGRGIRDLAQWLPDAERMLTQLETLSPDHKLSIRLADGTLVEPTGQQLFDFHGGVPDARAARAGRRARRARRGGRVRRTCSPWLPGAPAAEGGARADRFSAFRLASRRPVHTGNGASRVPGRAKPAMSWTCSARAAGGRGGRVGRERARSACSSAAWRPRTPGSGSWRSSSTRAPWPAGGPDPETCFNLGNVLYELDQKRDGRRALPGGGFPG